MLDSDGKIGDFKERVISTVTVRQFTYGVPEEDDSVRSVTSKCFYFIFGVRSVGKNLIKTRCRQFPGGSGQGRSFNDDGFLTGCQVCIGE